MCKEPHRNWWSDTQKCAKNVLSRCSWKSVVYGPSCFTCLLYWPSRPDLVHPPTHYSVLLFGMVSSFCLLLYITTHKISQLFLKSFEEPFKSIIIERLCVDQNKAAPIVQPESIQIINRWYLPWNDLDRSHHHHRWLARNAGCCLVARRKHLSHEFQSSRWQTEAKLTKKSTSKVEMHREGW